MLGRRARARFLTSRRASLVAERTAIKNRIHAVLHQRLLAGPEDLFGREGRTWLEQVALDDDGRAAIDSELRLLDGVESEIAALGGTLDRDGYHDERCKLLMTLPGVDVAVAQTLLAALGEVSRFPSGDKAASYLGLVPSTKQSADRTYHGPITKQGSGHARWMMVQAAQHLDKHPGPLGVFFRRLAKRGGTSRPPRRGRRRSLPAPGVLPVEADPSLHSQATRRRAVPRTTRPRPRATPPARHRRRMPPGDGRSRRR